METEPKKTYISIVCGSCDHPVTKTTIPGDLIPATIICTGCGETLKAFLCRNDSQAEAQVDYMDT